MEESMRWGWRSATTPIVATIPPRFAASTIKTRTSTTAARRPFTMLALSGPQASGTRMSRDSGELSTQELDDLIAYLKSL